MQVFASASLASKGKRSETIFFYVADVLNIKLYLNFKTKSLSCLKISF
jgi:hypothetical protein